MTPLAKRLSIFLAISIGLNLLLAGVWIGRGLHGPRGRAAHGLAQPGASVQSMGSRRNPVLRRAFEGKAPEFTARRKAARAARAAVAQSLEKTPFERGAVESAFSALRNENLRSQELLHGELVGMAERGSPELRREIGRTFLRERP